MASDWAVVFRDGSPADWRRAADCVAQVQGPTRLTLGDVTRAVRMGHGFVELMMDEGLARRIEQGLSSNGFEARALRWAECEPAPPAQRHQRVVFEGHELVPGLRCDQVHVLHLAMVQSAPFFLPPAASEGTRRTHQLATALSIGAQLLDLPDVGAFGAVRDAAASHMAPGAASTGAPELVIELCGLWSPRVHLPVDSFDFSKLGSVPLGRRGRLARLLEVLIARVPQARLFGAVDAARAQRDLSSLAPVEPHAHRRMLMAWLTAKRLWPG